MINEVRTTDLSFEELQAPIEGFEDTGQTQLGQLVQGLEVGESLRLKYGQIQASDQSEHSESVLDEAYPEPENFGPEISRLREDTIAYIEFPGQTQSLVRGFNGTEIFGVSVRFFPLDNALVPTQDINELNTPLIKKQLFTRLGSLIAKLEPHQALVLRQNQIDQSQPTNDQNAIVVVRDRTGEGYTYYSANDSFMVGTKINDLESFQISGADTKIIPLSLIDDPFTKLRLANVDLDPLCVTTKEVQYFEKETTYGEVAGVVSVGTRAENQDSALVYDSLQYDRHGKLQLVTDLLAVDGMGGGLKGELAAESIVTTFAQRSAHLPDPQERVLDVTQALVETLNQEEDSGPPSDCGAAAVATRILSPKEMSVTNLGDVVQSVYRQKELVQITEEHDLAHVTAENMHLFGFETMKDVEYKKDFFIEKGCNPKDVLTSAIIARREYGMDGWQAVDKHVAVQSVDLYCGDIVLIYDDGIANNISNDEIQDILRSLDLRGELYPEKIRQEIVNLLDQKYQAYLVHLSGLESEEDQDSDQEIYFKKDNFVLLVYRHQVGPEAP